MSADANTKRLDEPSKKKSYFTAEVGALAIFLIWGLLLIYFLYRLNPLLIAVILFILFGALARRSGAGW